MKNQKGKSEERKIKMHILLSKYALLRRFGKNIPKTLGLIHKKRLLLPCV